MELFFKKKKNSQCQPETQDLEVVLSEISHFSQVPPLIVYMLLSTLSKWCTGQI